MKNLAIDFKPPLRLEWRRCQDTPFGMICYPNVVVLNGKVYVGGGTSLSGREDQLVMVYDISSDQWNTLPPYQFSWFAMTALNDQLMLVGGVDKHTNKRTNMVGSFDETQPKWGHEFPPMHVARSGAAVVTHSNRWVVVAGGRGSTEAPMEILDSLGGQWYRANAPLPQKLCKMSSTVINSVWYLLGGYSGRESGKTVLSVHLDKLISQAVLQASAVKVTSTMIGQSIQWQTLPDTPLVGSTTVAYNGLLLAIGGEQEIDKGSSTIYYYHSVSDQWIRAGSLPSERKECGCAILPSGELFIVGGFIIPFMEQVDIGRVK